MSQKPSPMQRLDKINYRPENRKRCSGDAVNSGESNCISPNSLSKSFPENNKFISGSRAPTYPVAWYTTATSTATSAFCAMQRSPSPLQPPISCLGLWPVHKKTRRVPQIHISYENSDAAAKAHAFQGSRPAMFCKNSIWMFPLMADFAWKILPGTRHSLTRG